jgi:hypothetical protein
LFLQKQDAVIVAFRAGLLSARVVRENNPASGFYCRRRDSVRIARCSSG